MAEADTPAAPWQSKLVSNEVSARLQQVLALLFPSNLAAKAALFAAVVALLPLLPSSQAPRLWELPHLLLLGIIISYGVFGQKNADAEVAADKPAGDEPSVEAYVSEMMQGSFALGHNDRDVDDDAEEGGARDGGVRAWSSQYVPDDPIVVVAENGKGGDAGEKALHLPVRKLKQADEAPASPTPTGDISDGIEEEEEDDELRQFLAPNKTGYADVVRERAIPSPSSVLDADVTLSPSSSPPLLPPPPPPPPFLGSGRRRLHKTKARSFNEFGVRDRSGLLQSAGNKQQFRSKSAAHATRSAFTGYDDPAASIGYDEADDDDGELDEMVADAASDDSSFSFSTDDVVTDNDKEEDSYGEEEEDGDSCDDELFELATRPGPEADEVGDEVDRKAEEFIAKFRDQIRMHAEGRTG